MANILPHETYHQAIKIFKRCLEIFQKNGFLHYSSKKSSSLVVQFWLAKQIKDLSRCISIPISSLPQFCLSESILGEEVEVNWLVIIVKEEVGMRSDSYNSHPKNKTTTKKKSVKSLCDTFETSLFAVQGGFSRLSDGTKINLAETWSFSKQGWKSS